MVMIVEEIIEKLEKYSQFLANIATKEDGDGDEESRIEKAAWLLSEAAILLRDDGGQLRLPL